MAPLTLPLLLSSAVVAQDPGREPAIERAAGPTAAAIETVTVPSPESPIVAIRLMFDIGSIHDPRGKEGLAALTGLMIGQAGTAKRSYPELVDALYPMAGQFSATTDREVTVISGEIHRDKLAEYTALFTEALLTPGFAESDFRRNKELLLAYLTTTLRASNDELLGLEMLQQEIFAAPHPYGHSPAGTVAGLEAITLEDVKRFYQSNYTRGNLMLGVAGGYPADYVPSLEKALSALPAGERGLTALPPAPRIEGRNFTLVAKDTASVGIHLGYPIPVTRADADYYPLMVANSYLGEHRTMHGRLMQQLRELRGLNYGDYSYVEHWADPPFTNTPTPGFPRRQQYFSVWIRPVVPATAHFALRGALYEVERLTERGLTEDDFDLARDFLINYSKLWAQTLSQRLGFHMDSRYYGMPYYIDEIEKRLQGLTIEEVNAAARKYLQAERYDAVFITDEAPQVEAALEKDAPSPLDYENPKSAAILAADKEISPLEVRPTSIEILPVQEAFAGKRGLGPDAETLP